MSLTTTLSENEPLSVTIVDAVAEVTEADCLEMPILQDVVDVDALARLVAPRRRTPPTDVVVGFELAGCVVEVSSTGSVTVMEAAGAASGEAVESGPALPAQDSR